MKSHINFLRERRKLLTKTQEKDRFILKWATRIFAVVVVICVASVGVQFFFDRRLQTIQAAQDTAKQEIISSEETEKMIVIGYQKLKILSGLFEERADKQAAIAYFGSIFGSEVLVKQIEFKGDEKLLTFRLEANNVFVLEKVFQTIQNQPTKERFTKVTPSDLKRTSTGKYQMTVAVVL